jgi:hypothetical protein
MNDAIKAFPALGAEGNTVDLPSASGNNFDGQLPRSHVLADLRSALSLIPLVGKFDCYKMSISPQFVVRTPRSGEICR